MVAHDVKNYPILKVSSQGQSMSSKYDLRERVFLIHFYVWWRAENCHTSKKSHVSDAHDIKNYPILMVSSQEQSMSFENELKERVFLSHFYLC